MLWKELCEVLRMCVYTWSTFTLSRCDFCNLKQSQSGQKQVCGKTIIGIDHSEMKILPSFTPSCLSNRGATDRRWSVIRTDQSPRFGTHVIRGLTDKFNHHRVKVYHLHVLRFHTLKRAHAEARTRWSAHTLKHAHAEREREKERRDLDTAFQTTPQRMDTYTHTKLC